MNVFNLAKHLPGLCSNGMKLKVFTFALPAFVLPRPRVTSPLKQRHKQLADILTNAGSSELGEGAESDKYFPTFIL